MKVLERRVRWYGHVMRRDEHYVGTGEKEERTAYQKMVGQCEG